MFLFARARISWNGRLAAALALALLGMAAARPAAAVPAFAEQTGQPCAACHVGAFGPQLKPYGRDFKLHGYIASDGQAHGLPLALMLLGSFTHTKAAQAGGAAPGFRANDNAALDQASLFYAGSAFAGVGVFAQLTFDGVARNVQLDNVDIRRAAEGQLFGQDLVWGVTLNNNPTVQDPWNSTPAWGFPYNSSPLAPTPAAATLIDGALAQRVAGAGAYAFWNNSVYAEADAYLGIPSGALDHLGAGGASGPTLRDAAPYGRLAFVQDGSHAHFEVGGYALSAAVAPAGSADFPLADRFTDAAADASFQYIVDPAKVTSDMLSAHATVIHEWGTLTASQAFGAAPREQLTTLRADLSYSFAATWTPTVQVFQTSGSANAGYWGTPSGSPNSAGAVFDIGYVPWGKPDSPAPGLNLRLGLQYVDYVEFDGSRRGASRANSTYASVWTALRF